jgi:hypothetical protein
VRPCHLVKIPFVIKSNSQWLPQIETYLLCTTTPYTIRCNRHPVKNSFVIKSNSQPLPQIKTYLLCTTTPYTTRRNRHPVKISFVIKSNTQPLPQIETCWLLSPPLAVFSLLYPRKNSRLVQTCALTNKRDLSKMT